MGGDYYDRDVISSNTQSNQNQIQQNNNMVDNSSASIEVDKDAVVHSSNKPLRWIDENMTSDNKNPIIFALDITGSMGDWAKIIYDKMPMFYGQIMMQKYLPDPAISFCAIGDHTGDDEPLQVTEFGQGKAIDQLLSKLVLWKSGNGNEHESYELAAYFYENSVDLISPEMGFFFVTGDEGYFEQIEGKTIQTVFGKGVKQQFISSKEVWQKLMQKYNVFHLHKPYISANYEKKIKQQWNDLLGEERVLNIVSPKACVDVMLGAIALTSGKSLDSYIEDMKVRGQSEERIKEVTHALVKYSHTIETGEVKPVMFKISEIDTGKVNVPSVVVSGKNEVSQEDLDEVIQLYEKMLIEELEDSGVIFREQMKNLRLSKGSQVPKEFLCPVTKEILFDPVITCDGETFERKFIETWLEKHECSPFTGSKLESKILLPNFALKQLIRDYVQSSI